MNILYRRAKISARDFDPLKIIGRGAFGEVRVCKHKKTGEVVAIKKMKKTLMTRDAPTCATCIQNLGGGVFCY